MGLMMTEKTQTKFFDGAGPPACRCPMAFPCGTQDPILRDIFHSEKSGKPVTSDGTYIASTIVMMMREVLKSFLITNPRAGRATWILQILAGTIEMPSTDDLSIL